MSVILVLATFVSYIVFGRFNNKEDVLPSAARAEAAEPTAQPHEVQHMVANSEADRLVRAEIDRRQSDRRKRAA